MMKLRQGSLMLEAAVCTALLAIVFTVVAQGSVRLQQQAAQAERRTALQRELENAMEQLVAQPWDAIAEESEWERNYRASLISRKLRLQVLESDDPAPNKQVTLELTDDRLSGRQSLRLTTWVFRAAEQLP